jgi:hypothetical protein
MKKLIPLTLAIIIITSCNDESKNCKEQFVKEYNNELGHYYGFENRIVYEDHLNTKLNFSGSKNYDDTNAIKLIFYSKSDQLHFAIDHNQDDKLYIKAGNTIDTLVSKVYNRVRQPQSQFEETISYEIPAPQLKNLLDKGHSQGGEMKLSNYRFIISDEIACSLHQLIGAESEQREQLKK